MGFGEKDKNRGDGHIDGHIERGEGGRGLSIGEVIQTFCTLWSMVLFFHTVLLFSDELN